MKKIIFVAFFIFSTALSNAQKKQAHYTKQWEKVHKQELDKLPKSALKLVDEIYKKAKKDKNAAQIVKTLLYKSKFALTLKENAQLEIIEQFNQEIKTAHIPTKNILENILASLYWQYYQQNRWKIYDRTETSKKTNARDFRTWGLNTLFTEIQFHFENSLQNKSMLQKTDLNLFNSILELQPDSKLVRPTLYDFLAHNALDFYKTDETRLTRPLYKFEINNTSYFTELETVNILSKDSLSPKLHALKTYQSLLQFHKNDKNPHAYITASIAALKFIKQHATLTTKATLFLQSLISLKNKYRHHTSSTLIDFEIATIYKNQANSLPKKEAYLYKNKESLDLCNLAIQLYPESEGALKCESLKREILSNSLRIISEQNIPSQTNSRLLVDYKNIDHLYFTLYKITAKQKTALQTTYNDSTKIAFIKKLPLLKKWNSALKNENDYLQHKTELVLPKLSLGNYLIFTTTENDSIKFNKTNAHSTIQITNLALLQNNNDEEYTYQLVNRTTGKPIKDAHVQLKNYNRGRYNKLLNKNFTTNSKGQFSFKSKHNYNSIIATVKHKEETATFGDYYLYQNYRVNDEDVDEIEIKPFVFTDRSIYRPGQKIHFKAIVLKKTGRKSEVFANEYVEVILENPNEEEIKVLDLKLNEFGSVAGEFDLPTNGLTGEYSIIIDESSSHDSKFYDDADFEFHDGNGFSIAVEEYKRPKFKTEFKPVTETFKLNDSIVAAANATAFSGSTISGAKVNYRVVRTANFPRWYNWYSRNLQQSEKLEISHGETTTDAKGNYQITFKAIPDLKIDKKRLPTFNYRIFADVTDLNGETRSAETSIKVGYHAMLATVSIASKINKRNKNNTIGLSTKNLNGEFISANGNLKIHKLIAPKKPLRNRPWSAPDYQTIPKDKFEKLFPHDPYTDKDDNVKNWKKGNLVFEKKFNTKKEKEIVLKNIKKWNSGKYSISIECKDKFEQLVKDEKYFDVFSTKDKKVSDNKLFSISINKTTYSPNENVELQIGSASSDITINLSVEKNHKIVATHLIHLNNEIKIVEIPVTEKDRGGFAIKYHYVNYNSFKSGSLSIAVPYTLDALQIETGTFRNKLQPGATQTWSFKIKGKEKEKITAEILASMYDASLDEFKKHQWNFTPIQQQSYYSYGNDSNGRTSFRTHNFKVRNLNRYYAHFTNTSYDKLNWFGFSMNNNKWKNQRYLNNIKKTIVLKNSYDAAKEKGIISGTVYDEDKNPLPGVTLQIGGTTKSTQTGFDGRFSIKAKKREELILNYVGFKTTSINITKNNIYNIVLTQDSSNLDEVVIVGYGTQKKANITGSVTRALSGRVAGMEMTEADNSIMIRGYSSLKNTNKPLYIIDGVIVEGTEIPADDLASMEILKGAAATSLYGARAANGVVLISTKSGQKKLDAEMASVQARTNLQETAFFFPQLKTDNNGNVSFEFTAPEAITRWKLQLLAHTKELKTATKTLTTITQKELMVTPNAPRFLREGDEIIFSAKIANLTKNKLDGFAQLQLSDALTGKDINLLLNNKIKNKNFTTEAKGNTQVSWTLQIPENIQAVQYKIVAKAGNFSDGEQSVLPVLSNRMLVTETLPMWVRSNQTKTFTLDKLKNNTSSTLKHHKLTLEMTSNPAWYAIQALPYLMEYPYECAEQTFARYYANALASHIETSNPKIQKVFKKWATSDALLSNLEKNKELKSIIIEETPWLRDAQSETAQKKRIGLLFDLNKMKTNLQATLDKLKQMQMSNGGFPWFKGSDYANRNITQHIVTGFGHLNKLGVVSTNKKTKQILKKAISFLDDEILFDYNRLIRQANEIKKLAKTKSKGLLAEKKYLAQNHLGSAQLHYLYMRSFFPDFKIDSKTQKALTYYKNQSATFWKENKLYNQGLIALLQFRDKNALLANKILASLKENSILSERMGMYWKENKASWYWYQSPIETQSLLIEAFSEIENDTKTIDNLKIWLLKNKQTNQWKTTKATTEAVYALLFQGSDWLSVNESVAITIGDKKLTPEKLKDVKIEAGTGYFKTSWKASEITPEMATVTLSKKDKGIAWGGLYWQYFEDLDQITSAKTPLQLHKKIFLKTNSDTGKKLTEITSDTKLNVGDLITIRIELKSDRDMSFIHMKDMRASGVEPTSVLSEYKWQDGLGYYQSTKDASTNFFFDSLKKGIYIFEYDVRINNSGNFSNGITTIQSMYAPEFSSHSEGIRIEVK